MDKEQLKQIAYLKTEIETIKKQIDELENITLSDKVKGSSSHYPYVERSFTIEGIDTGRVGKLQRKLQRKIDDLMDTVEETNLYIDNIKDSLTRQVISLKYVNGMTWEQVAAIIGYKVTPESVRKVAERFLEKI